MIKKFLVWLIVLVNFTSCAKAEDEYEYKKAAIELNEMLLKLESIPVQTKEIERTDKGVKFIHDHTQRAEFIEKTKNEWLSIAQRLNNVAKLYPEGKWADDSLFCLVIFINLNPSEKPNEFDDVVIAAIEELLYVYPTIKLEKWTNETFKQVFFDKFYPSLKSSFPKELPLEDQFRAELKLYLAVELRKKGDITTTMKLLTELKSKFIGTEFEKMIQDQVELTRRQ